MFIYGTKYKYVFIYIYVLWIFNINLFIYLNIFISIYYYYINIILLLQYISYYLLVLCFSFFPINSINKIFQMLGKSGCK